MCKSVCTRWKIDRVNFYCQGCARYIPESQIKRENGESKRRRCKCCNGLVRNKPKIMGLRKWVPKLT